MLLIRSFTEYPIVYLNAIVALNLYEYKFIKLNKTDFCMCRYFNGNITMLMKILIVETFKILKNTLKHGKCLKIHKMFISWKFELNLKANYMVETWTKDSLHWQFIHIIYLNQF